MRPGVRPAVLLLILCLLGPCPAQGRNLTINTSHGPPRSTESGTGFLDRAVVQAFGRLGVNASIAHRPSERALIQANAGLDDGNFARVAGIEKYYPNLVMVPEPVTVFNFTVFSRDQELRIEKWEDLALFHVGIVIGWKILEEHITQARSLTKVKDGEALFALLAHGRIDVAVYDLLQGQDLVRRKGLSGITAHEPPLARQDMFLYLNRRHLSLVPLLTGTLRDMKRDGTLDRLVEEALSEDGRP